MINGNLLSFLDKLNLGEELEVSFRGRVYLIQGYWKPIEGEKTCEHIEMFLVGGEHPGEVVFEADADSSPACAILFRDAPIWDGLRFDEVESEIEWIA